MIGHRTTLFLCFNVHITHKFDMPEQASAKVGTRVARGDIGYRWRSRNDSGSSRRRGVEDGANTIKRKTLLVIDDDVEWTDLLRIFFSRKYNVCVSNRADEAIEAIRSELPSVIILDLIMPSVDGFGLMHRMNEMSLGEVPTVLTTGWGNPDVEQCAAAVGCAAVLTKPVSLVELDATVSSLMSGSGVPGKGKSLEPPEEQTV